MLPRWLGVGKPPVNARDPGDTGLIPRLGTAPGEGNGDSLTYSCLEKSHGQRSLAGHSPWGHKSSTLLSDSACARVHKHRLYFMLCVLCDPLDYSPPFSSAHEISQARIVEWVAISYSREAHAPQHRVAHLLSGRESLHTGVKTQCSQ